MLPPTNWNVLLTEDQSVNAGYVMHLDCQKNRPLISMNFRKLEDFIVHFNNTYTPTIKNNHQLQSHEALPSSNTFNY